MRKHIGWTLLPLRTRARARSTRRAEGVLANEARMEALIDALVLRRGWHSGVLRWNAKLLLSDLAAPVYAVETVLPKRPKSLAVIVSGADLRVHALRLLLWAIDAGCQRVLVYDEAGVLLQDAATAPLLATLRACPPCTRAFGQGDDVVALCVNDGAIEHFRKAPGRVVHVDFQSSRSSGRDAVVQACLQVPPLATADEAMRVLDVGAAADALIVCGHRFGNFSPMGLKSCEFYFVAWPPSHAEFCLALETFSVSEQRRGA